MPKFRPKKYRLLLVIAASLIFLHIVKILLPLELFISKDLRPVLTNFYLISSKLRLSYNLETDKRDLASKLKESEGQINYLTAENARLKVLEQENNLLRQQLKFLSRNKFRYILANILSRGETTDTAKNNQIVTIDKGAKDGIYPGLAVVIATAKGGLANQGIIIGKITSVKDYLSEVYLTTNQQCKLGVSLDGQNATNGIASGALGLTIKMDFIPQTVEINSGQSIITSGLEQSIPRGLVVGKVAAVTKENNELWQSAVIEPLINFDELTVVTVLLP